ncbi:hypothetical protein A2524_00350 [Candidatus Wolfebacteria bacterium RIFOXYD12_FULL_48_21]|uniref:HAD family hydrolase n=1 Tax=Candidatus Wolfebacteria bacterium RIFOXYD1_FULL_48_65 TaxID=1802561 RepID=A0A1F8E1G4_9BACT|nr:MAG: hypothetical protein A2610_01485 [Candidatus Wolfebacteria bacterium RIFOXYD1_FULL_48_65]OGM94893.1 MAG: hypothetical protein A2524_00350 [Candidatus Wolfebacteria bacterium RIFOXYD12_FULL_48_21]OGM97304.1 MAG: hypothetical protein A2532_02050 [Candidatus Wolfebacteria bacterium RIFOXYD2_FULL_48_11]
MGKAWIFDLDGTLVRTQTEFHATAETEVLKECGIIVNPEDITVRFSGVHTLEVFRQLAPHCDAHELLAEKWKYMIRLANTKPIHPIECAPQLIHRLYTRGVPMGIASASPTAWIVRCLTSIRATPYFTCHASVDEVAQGKPAPDVFLLAAKRMEVDAADCVAVEDGEAGVYAALAAGMQTFWLTESDKVIPGAVKIDSLVQLIAAL